MLGNGFLPMFAGAGGGRTPILDLNFLSGVLDPRITFTRSSSATRVNASGLIETVGSNVPRFDYDPVTLQPKGLLIEESRTNLITSSSQINFNGNGGASISGNYTDPSGSNNAKLWNGVGFLRKPATNSSAKNTVSIYAKANGTGGYFRIGGYYGVGNSELSFYNTFRVKATGEVTAEASSGAASATVGTVHALGNGWYRCVCAASSYNEMIVEFVSGQPSLYLWGAQLEAGSFATSYIPTITAAVTRAADNASITGSNFSSWYNQSQGTFMGEFGSITTVVSGRTYLIAMDNNPAYRVVRIHTNGNGAILSDAANGGSAQFTLSKSRSNVLGELKVAIAYASGDTAMSVDGTAPATSSALVVPVVSRLHIGADHSMTTFINSHIRRICYYNERLPNEELQALTA